MKLIIDCDKKTLSLENQGNKRELDLYSKEAFELISRQWLKMGWNQKYTYTFSWMGRPVIQLPEDMIRIQEVVFRLQPDVIIETGVAHGGSLIFFASLCKVIGKGRVIGIDIEIRPHNRKAIEEHDLYPYITLVEGSSIAPEIVKQVKALVEPEETTLVILDSNHSRQHVLGELQQYGDLVTPGSYIVATDGIMIDLHDVPRGNEAWKEDNPVTAVEDFLSQHPEFALETPPWPFNEGDLDQNITHWPSAWLKRK